MLRLFNSLTYIVISFFSNVLGITPTVTPSPIPTSTSIEVPTPTQSEETTPYIEAYSEFRKGASVPGGFIEVKISLRVPETGGVVTGRVRGGYGVGEVCEGSITGTYDGNTVLSGNAQGSCVLLGDVQASWTGSLNRENHRIPINYQGSAGGFLTNGEVTLAY